MYLNFKMISKLSFLVTILSTISPSWGMNEDFLREMKCSVPPKPDKVGLDMKWYGSVETWYVPLWNKFYAVRTASEVLGRDVSLLSEMDLKPSSCMVFKKGGYVAGFGREAVKYNMTGDANSITFQGPWIKSHVGNFNYYLTDNKSFLLGLTCWDDGEVGWSVMSSKTCLEPEARTKIFEYVRSLGFSLNKVVEENYSLCGNMKMALSPYNMMSSHMVSQFNPYQMFHGLNGF